MGKEDLPFPLSLYASDVDLSAIGVRGLEKAYLSQSFALRCMLLGRKRDLPPLGVSPLGLSLGEAFDKVSIVAGSSARADGCHAVDLGGAAGEGRTGFRRAGERG